jgi:UDP-glucose 4-epimerase
VKRVLITGGAGFIGSHIVDCYSQDHKVLIVDDLRTGWLSNLAVSPNVPVVRSPLGSLEVMGTIESFKPQIVIHMAAQLEVSAGYEDPISELDQNLAATVELLEACRKVGSVQHFVFGSSACVYGRGYPRALQEIYDGGDRMMYENARPQWTYGASKLSAEHYVNIYSRYFLTTSLRFGIVFGPREWYGRVLTNFARRAAQGKPPIVFGDGSATRDFTYVRDAARACRRVTDDGDPGSGPVDIGSGTQISIADLAALFGTPEFEDVPEGGSSEKMPGRLRLPNEMEFMTLEPHLDLETRTITDEGLFDEYMDYARSNPEQWKDEEYRV